MQAVLEHKVQCPVLLCVDFCFKDFKVFQLLLLFSLLFLLVGLWCVQLLLFPCSSTVSLNHCLRDPDPVCLFFGDGLVVYLLVRILLVFRL